MGAQSTRGGGRCISVIVIVQSAFDSGLRSLAAKSDIAYIEEGDTEDEIRASDTEHATCASGHKPALKLNTAKLSLATCHRCSTGAFRSRGSVLQNLPIIARTTQRGRLED